jgi:hypothetical protein
MTTTAFITRWFIGLYVSGPTQTRKQRQLGTQIRCERRSEETVKITVFWGVTSCSLQLFTDVTEEHR